MVFVNLKIVQAMDVDALKNKVIDEYKEFICKVN